MPTTNPRPPSDGGSSVGGYTLPDVGGVVEGAVHGLRTAGWVSTAGQVAQSLPANLTSVLIEIVDLLPTCLCSRGMNWDGLFDAMVTPILTGSSPLLSAHVSFSSLQQVLSRMYTYMGGCTATACKAVVEKIADFLQRPYLAGGARATQQATQKVCTASTVARCTRRCGRCDASTAVQSTFAGGGGNSGGSNPPPPSVEMPDPDAHRYPGGRAVPARDRLPLPTISNVAKGLLRGEGSDGGFAPTIVRSVGRNLTRLVAIQSEAQRWGRERLDAFGTPCSAQCSTTCAVDQNPFWMPACTLQLTCPPKNVAGFRLKMKAVLAATIEEFAPGSPARERYKTKLATFLSAQGAPVNKSDISLDVQTASIAVEATIETPSVIASQIISDTFANMTAEDASYALNTTVETLQTTLGNETVAGESGSLGVPPSTPGQFNSGNPGGGDGNSTAYLAIIFGVVGAILGSFVAIFAGKRAMSSQAGKPMQLDAKLPSGYPASSRPPSAPKKGTSGVGTEFVTKHELGGSVASSI